MIKTTKLLFNPSMKAPIAEAYKTLRTNIQFSSLDQELKVILITSVAVADGKSTTSSNLAITMAQSEKRVILIDCDLRKPSIHRAFGVLNAKGLTNVLVEGIDYRTICNTVGVPNLEVLTSGPKPPNPSELLGTAKMESFINKVSQDYDMIILDAPPTLPVTDAAVLSRLADGVIMVISYGTTPHEMAVRAKDSLEKVGARIIGSVINRVPTKGFGAYYSYYTYYGDESKRTPRLHDKRAKV
jgi:capsular exopolysaccharide synthesis family protein